MEQDPRGYQQIEPTEGMEQEGADGSDRITEEWETGTDQQGYADDGCAASTTSDPPTRLESLIIAHREEILLCEEIISSQVGNTIELQSTCEKLSCTLSQIPALKRRSNELLQQAFSGIKELRNDQVEISNLINYTAQAYDDSIASINTMKEEYAILEKQNHERVTIFKVDMAELATSGESIEREIIIRTKRKREHCLTVRSQLSEMETIANKITEIDEEVDGLFNYANKLNTQNFESEKNVAAKREALETLRNEIRMEQEVFAKKTDDYSKKILANSTDLRILCDEIQKIRAEDGKLSHHNSELRNQLSSLKQKMAVHEKEKQHKMSIQISLSLRKTELEDQIATMSKTLDSLTRIKNTIESEGTAKIKSLEVEVDRVTNECREHKEQFEQKIEKISAQEESMRNIQNTINALETENTHLAEELSKLRNECSKKREDDAIEEERLSKEIAIALGRFRDLNVRMNSISDRHQQCEVKLAELKSRNKSFQGELETRNLETLKKENFVNHSTREWERYQSELAGLYEEKNQILAHRAEVTKLHVALSQLRKELSHLTESKSLVNVNDLCNQKIEEIMKEVEAKKQEYRSVIQQKTDEADYLEKQSVSKRAELTALLNMSKDAKYQGELFNCEQSLLTTFAQWVLGEGSPVSHKRPAGPEEPWVTSTSEGKLVDTDQPEKIKAPDMECKVSDERTTNQTSN